MERPALLVRKVRLVPPVALVLWDRPVPPDLRVLRDFLGIPVRLDFLVAPVRKDCPDQPARLDLQVPQEAPDQLDRSGLPEHPVRPDHPEFRALRDRQEQQD